MGQPIARRSYGFHEAEQVGNAIAQASVMLVEAQHQASHDTLTGLANRSMFCTFLQQQIAVAERHGSDLAVIYIDLDNFKPINDTFGHAAGDALLIEAASRLASLLRRSDLAARIGGDEFAVAFSGTGAGIAVVQEKLQTVMEAPYHIDGVPVRADASLGVARYPGDGKTVAELLEKADDAMYEEKARKKSRQPG